MKVVQAGSKYDGDDYLRLKLHEEYGRVWLYSADRFGNSVERILCIDDDGLIRIAANHLYNPETHEIKLTFPLSRRADMKHDSLNVQMSNEYTWRLKD